MVRKKIRIQRGQTIESYKKSFLNEQYCLRLLGRLEHKNIIPLLASYTYGGEHFFLFPSYEMDLAAFLKRETRFANFKQDFTFYAALRGLSSALCHTHKLHLVEKNSGLDLDMIGYHHDLRPANVLISRETFILADFGLGRLKSQDSPSETHWKVGRGDYLAPECMGENFAHQDVGRAIDVWAFGCLMLEVATYMDKGFAGLKKFRGLRMGTIRHDHWEESSFHDKDGFITPTVQLWMASLRAEVLPASPIIPLIRLARKALTTNPKQRPTIRDIYTELSFISLRAHFVFALNAFQSYAEELSAKKRHIPAGMKLRFTIERLTAFGHALGLDGVRMDSIHSEDLEPRYEEYLKPLTTILLKLGPESLMIDSSIEVEVITNSTHVQIRLQDDLSEYVESLWNLLPAKEKMMAEATWLRAMLETDDVGRLDDVEQSFKFQDSPVYEQGAAMAMIKKIRIEMESNPTTMPKGFLVSRQDVKIEHCVSGHDLGLFKGKLPVLIEWMSYSSQWEKVPPEQRTIIMALKAQGFSEEARPAARMRTLDCIATFEDPDEKAGYGFVYRIPESDVGTKFPPSIMTLLQFLTQPQASVYHRPLLGNKFRLASALARFVGDFHNVGWLHGSFNSNNVVFFNIGNRELGSYTLPAEVLGRPYVVGLHKSRPGGRVWETTGPGTNAVFEDYQHPEYLRTRRYRAIHDYYSLGLVLLEIGFWRALCVWSESPKCLKMSAVEFRQELLERYVPRLGAEMGAAYQDVVKFCLDQPVDDDGDDLDIDTETVFTEEVIEPLEELARMPI